MGGRSVGMRVPEMPASTCEPIDAQNPEGPLMCPTHGLDKFQRMADLGDLRTVFREGETSIYEVVR
jgi:hypothetical protein